MLTLGMMPGMGYVYEWEWNSGRLKGEWGEEVDIARLDSTTEGTSAVKGRGRVPFCFVQYEQV